MDTIVQDLRYAVRTLLKSPGFTLLALVTLALGIGANTAMFSVVDAVLLRPLPYREQGRLVYLTEKSPQLGTMMVAYPDYLDWRTETRTFEDLAVYNRYQNLNLTGAAEPERIPTALVTANVFRVLGARPALGHDFAPDEDRRGAPREVMLSDGLWRRRFGADASIVGKTVSFDGQSYTVVGVMPRDFVFGAGVEQWAPLGPVLDDNWMNRGNHLGLVAVGRMKPGVTVAQATQDIAAVARRLEQQYPASNGGIGVNVYLMNDVAVGGTRPALLSLLGAVGFVLLIACANLAHLMLARATRRQREVALRAALGASRGRLLRQFLTESLLLALLGGALALLLAWWGTGLLRAFGAGRIPRAGSIAVDARVLGFTLGVSILTGLAFGVVPALRVARTALHDALKEGARTTDAGPGRHRLRSFLVTGEVALSFVLVIAAGLLVRSIVNLQRVHTGFDAAGVLVADIALPRVKYAPGEPAHGFFRQVLERLHAIPAVRYAAVASPMPFGQGGWQAGITIDGVAEPGPGQNPLVDAALVSADYFRAMGIPLLAGRFFTDQDDGRVAGAVIVNAAMAKRFWPGRPAVGGRIHFGPASANEPWLTVVGVVGDVKQEALEEDPRPTFYLSYLQHDVSTLTVVVRSGGDPAQLVPELRDAVRSVDRDQPLFGVSTLGRLVAESEAPRRFMMSLFGLFAGLALVLAAVGTYGVMVNLVAQRTHEMGIRIALGARADDVLALVVGQGMRAVAAGLAAGAIIALALTRLVARLLYGVSATDLPTFVVAALVLTGVGVLACWVPARRAAKVDPMVALRSE